MPRAIDFDDIVRMLSQAAKSVALAQETLSRLDSFGGDGDHGTTMVRAMKRLEGAIEASESRSVPDLLRDVGWAILGVDGGATGPLLGMLFTGMSEAAGQRESLDVLSLAEMFEAGLAAVERQTRARVGDKTLMDALVPAVHALRMATQEDFDVDAALECAASAAEEGAAATAQMEARFGRAKHVGSESVGHADPGATSISLLFRGFVQGIN